MGDAGISSKVELAWDAHRKVDEILKAARDVEGLRASMEIFKVAVEEAKFTMERARESREEDKRRVHELIRELPGYKDLHRSTSACLRAVGLILAEIGPSEPSFHTNDG